MNNINTVNPATLCGWSESLIDTLAQVAIRSPEVFYFQGGWWFRRAEALEFVKRWRAKMD